MLTEFPGFQNIFSLGEPFATRPFRGSLREAAPGLNHYALASGQVVPCEPIRIVAYGGRELTDFIWTDAAVVRLVSQRLLELLRASGIVGWSTFPVEVYGRRGEAISGFEGLSVTGRCGKINAAMSTPIQKRMPGGFFPYFKGYFFKPETWDGSDVFAPDGTSHIFVTRAVHDCLRDGHARNVAYQPLTEIEFGEYEKALIDEKQARA
jgi:hypothetical protein